MKIQRVVAHPLAADVERPIHFAIGAYGTFYATLVEITTDDGLTGVGECIARKAPRVTATVVEELMAPVLIGRDPRDIGALWDAMFVQLRKWGHSRGFVIEAISGIDTALWDLVARAQGEPLYKALRGAGRDRVPVYASKVYFNDRDHMVREAQSQVGRGFHAIKVQIGRPQHEGGIRTDYETVRAIREGVGPDLAIMLDANGKYDAATAIRLCKQLEPLDITWIEEPVPPDDVSGYELIRRSQAIPLAGGESEFGLFGFRDLIERRAIDVLQPDVARSGGVSETLKMIGQAGAHHVAYAPHVGFSAGVSHLAALHVAAATPNLMTYEYMFIDHPLLHIFTTPFPEPREGMMDLPQGPGLGLEVDWGRVKQFELR